MMKFDEFEALVQTYGANEARWPDQKRPDMKRIIAAHPEQARSVLDNAKVIDEALGVLPEVHASDLLKSRIQKTAHHIPQSQNLSQVSRRPFGGWARIAAMVAVSFSAGFSGAQFVDLQPGSQSEPVEIIASTDTQEDADWAMAATELGFAEIYEWTSGEEVDVSVNDL